MALVTSELSAGRFVRQPNAFTDRITADGSSGFAAEPGRYHLYVSLACPWAQRSLIVRRLLGLEEVVSMSVVDPIRDERGWAFTDEHPDPVNGFRFLWAYTRDLYQHPGFGGTTDFDHIKRHYFGTHRHLNPSGIVPKGPAIDWSAPHGRQRLGGGE